MEQYDINMKYKAQIISESFPIEHAEKIVRKYGPNIIIGSEL